MTSDGAEELYDGDFDPVGRRMHVTPRRTIFEAVERLRLQGWQIELSEARTGELTMYDQDVSATQDTWDESGKYFRRTIYIASARDRAR